MKLTKLSFHIQQKQTHSLSFALVGRCDT